MRNLNAILFSLNHETGGSAVEIRVFALSKSAKARRRHFVATMASVVIAAVLPTIALVASTPGAASADTPTPATSTAFGYPDFNSTSDLVFNGFATATGGAARLTSNDYYQQGGFWRNTPVSPFASFSTGFRAQIGGDAEADGFAFLISSSGTSSLGPGGGELGYQGMLRSAAVEFDIWNNGGSTWELSEPHIGIGINGQALNNVIAAPPGFSLTSGAFSAWVDYDASRHLLSAYASQSATKPSTPIVSYNVDLAAILGTEFPTYVGFTGGTGSRRASQDILNWGFNDPVGGSISPLETLGGSNPSIRNACACVGQTGQPIHTACFVICVTKTDEGGWDFGLGARGSFTRNHDTTSEFFGQMCNSLYCGEFGAEQRPMQLVSHRADDPNDPCARQDEPNLLPSLSRLSMLSGLS